MSSKKTFIMALLFAFVFTENKEIFGIQYCTKKSGNIVKNWNMNISRSGDITKILIEDDVYKKEVFLNNNKIQKIQISENRILVRSVLYDYINGYVVVKQINGKSIREIKYTLENEFWENETLIYLIGNIDLKSGERYIFHHLNSEKLRRAEMYVKNNGLETIYVNGKSFQAIKYEMGLNGFLLSKIWPHKYYWWYEEKTGKFLQYEGMGENGVDLEKSEIAEDDV